MCYYSLMKKILLTKEKLTLIISTLFLGVAVGLSSLLLSLFLDLIERLFLNFKESAAVPAALGVSGIHRLLSVVVGGMIAAIIWWIIRTKVRPPVTIANGLKGKEMPFYQTIIHVATQIFYVGTGGSIGRELAPREIGAMIAQHWNRLLKRCHLAELSTADQRLLIAAAAGAGFAGIYIAPITGMLFCVEILLKKIDLRTISVSLTMSVIAMLMGSLVKGFGPYYQVPTTNFPLLILPFVLVAAPLCGIIGAYFRKSFKWAEARQTKDRQILWQLPLAAALTGAISIFFPQIMGNGRALAQLAFDTTGTKLVAVLLFGALAKAIVTVITIRTGAAGGTLTPSISLGAAIGVLSGLLFINIVPQLSLVQCALIGACSLLATTQQAPLMALFMIIEISHLSYSAFLPLGLSVILAVMVSQLFLKKQ